jgi:hypothetical protein
MAGQPIAGLRSEQLPLVFLPDNVHVHERATRALIAHPVQQYDHALQTGNLYATGTTFRPIARRIDIFEYGQLYYFYGWFDIWGDAGNKRRGIPQMANVLAVFLHRGGTTKQICEYRLNGNDFPTP